MCNINHGLLKKESHQRHSTYESRYSGPDRLNSFQCSAQSNLFKRIAWTFPELGNTLVLHSRVGTRELLRFTNGLGCLKIVNVYVMESTVMLSFTNTFIDVLKISYYRISKVVAKVKLGNV